MRDIPIDASVSTMDRSARSRRIQSRFYRIFCGKFNGLPAVFNHITDARGASSANHVGIDVSLGVRGCENVQAFSRTRQVVYVDRVVAKGVIFLSGDRLFFHPLRSFQTFSFNDGVTTSAESPSWRLLLFDGRDLYFSRDLRRVAHRSVSRTICRDGTSLMGPFIDRMYSVLFDVSSGCSPHIGFPFSAVASSAVPFITGTLSRTLCVSYSGADLAPFL